MLAIQKYLREKGLEAAIKEFSLVTNTDGPLVQLNYSMIDSPKAAQECCECRGLILDSGNNWKVVAYPFYRFFNEGEGPAAKLDIRNSALQQKLDGSLITLYWHPYRDVWQPATRGRILADGTVGKNGCKTFSKLFMEATIRTDINEDNLHKDCCYVFELTGPENRVLSPYKETTISLIAARNIADLVEINDTCLNMMANRLGVARPIQYTFENDSNIRNLLENLRPTDEGFVLVDYSNQINGNYQRIKIKNPRYLALSHLLGAGDEDLLNSERVVILIQTGEIDEVLTYFPEYAEQIKAMRGRLDKLAAEFQAEYDRIARLGGNRKEFAAEAVKYKHPAVLFNLLDKKMPSTADYVKKMRPEVLLKIIQE
jgi:hypothetical protein